MGGARNKRRAAPVLYELVPRLPTGGGGEGGSRAAREHGRLPRPLNSGVGGGATRGKSSSKGASQCGWVCFLEEEEEEEEGGRGALKMALGSCEETNRPNE